MPIEKSAAKTRRTGEERVRVQATVQKSVAERLEAEAEARMIGVPLLVERGIQMVLDALPPLPDVLADKGPDPEA